MWRIFTPLPRIFVGIQEKKKTASNHKIKNQVNRRIVSFVCDDTLTSIPHEIYLLTVVIQTI